MDTQIKIKVNEIFETDDFRTSFLGATIMDTNPYSGFNEKLCTRPTKGAEPEFSPINSLLLYPEVEEINKSDDSSVVKNDLYMSCCWLTGFTPVIGGLPACENMARNCYNFLKGKGVITTDQVVKARPDWFLNSLFSSLSWFGSSKKKIINGDYEAGDVEKTIKKGLVSPTWTTDPIEIRYVVTKKKSNIASPNHVPADYIYFVGGSPDVIGDDLSNLSTKIYQMYEQIKQLKEEYKKSTTKSKISERTDSKTLWYASVGKEDNLLAKANVISKKLLRTVSSIFLIRNYFVYAQNKLGIASINEISYDSVNNKPIFNKINIGDIIKKYDIIYTYCKNLCYIFPDIAKADII